MLIELESIGRLANGQEFCCKIVVPVAEIECLRFDDGVDHDGDYRIEVTIKRDTHIFYQPTLETANALYEKVKAAMTEYYAKAQKND